MAEKEKFPTQLRDTIEDMKIKEEVKEEVTSAISDPGKNPLGNVNSLAVAPAASPMESPFMQQQSQICVFSTNLANNGADAVRTGLFKSIRDYHMSQPDTKQYLQKTQNRVPNDNLTPEQVQRREEKIASLRKLHQMLLDPANPSRPTGPGPNMDNMPGHPPGQGPMMPSPQPMSGPPGGMPTQAGAVMSGPGPMMPGPPGGPGFGPRGPGSFENPAQREWYKLQHEFFVEKQRKENAERLWYFQQMQTGPRPMHPFPGPPGNREFGPDFNFFPQQMQPGGPPMDRNLPGVVNKPPPPYTQSNKRKRSSSDTAEEVHKRLQPAPSPKQFSSLTQFEGQELKITKQLNTAYQDGPLPPSSISCSSAPPLASVSSPMPNNVASRPSSVSAISAPNQPSQSQPTQPTNGSPADQIAAPSHPAPSDSAYQECPPSSVPSTSGPPASSVSSPMPNNNANSRPASVSSRGANQLPTSENNEQAPHQLPKETVDTNSPGFSRPSPNPVGNANVHIQAKAPNTIQYLPAVPPSSVPGPANARVRKDMAGPKVKPPFMPNGPMMPEHAMQRMPGPSMLGPSGPYGRMHMQPGMMGPKMNGPFPAGNGPMMPDHPMARMPGPGPGPGPGPNMMGPGGPYPHMPMQQGMMGPAMNGPFPAGNGPMMPDLGMPRMHGFPDFY